MRIPLPPSSFIRKTKYRLESVTASTAIPGYCSTGHLANNSPGRDNFSLVMRKLAFCICENKDADQLRGNRKADQRLCFRYTDNTISLLPKSEISSL